MEPSKHTLSELFQQLGLPYTSGAIDAFIASHRSLPRDLSLDEASFWTSSQRQFLRDAIDDDADWAELVDDLSARLH